MEFSCVFSVNGSLATYEVKKESGDLFTAKLRTGQGGRTDIPAELTVERTATGWQSAPQHDEILRNLVYALEAKGPAAG